MNKQKETKNYEIDFEKAGIYLQEERENIINFLYSYAVIIYEYINE